MPSERPFIIVAIDGGAAAGKSSTAQALSGRHQLLHVDTGSFYRTLTLYLLKRGIRPDEPGRIGKALSNPAVATELRGREARMAIDGEVPGEELRSGEVNAQVSGFAAEPVVREFLLDYQRGQTEFARANGFSGLVMEGRDIGSVIFPGADFRFFLEADSGARSRRRSDQGQEDSIEARDRIDSRRQSAPLICPEGAIRIDTTEMSLEEVIEKVSALIQSKTA